MEEAQVKAIKDLSEAGWTRSKISKLLGISLVKIRSILGNTKKPKKPEVTIIDVISIDQSASMASVQNETNVGVTNYLKDMKVKAKETKNSTF